MKLVIATIKQWNIDLAVKFCAENLNKHEIIVISEKSDLLIEEIDKIKPKYIFFPHWSWKIPKEIFSKYNCIAFHMTDLPFGRGGSPLQNLIESGVKNTKISAFKVGEGFDDGDIYLKKDLNINGFAEEIFIRAADIIFNEMIPEIIDNDIEPVKQQGEVVIFKRRKKEDGEIYADFELAKIYDYIRMLDAEGYPRAFIKFGNFRLEFSKAILKNGKIAADVEIIEGD